MTSYWDRNESRGQDLTRQFSISSHSQYDVDKTGGSLTKKRSTRRSWRIHNMQAVNQPSSTANSSATTCLTDWLTECPSFTPLAPLAAAVFVVGPPNFVLAHFSFFFWCRPQVLPEQKTEKIAHRVELATLEMFLAWRRAGRCSPRPSRSSFFHIRKKRVPT